MAVSFSGMPRVVKRPTFSASSLEYSSGLEIGMMGARGSMLIGVAYSSKSGSMLLRRNRTMPVNLGQNFTIENETGIQSLHSPGLRMASLSPMWMRTESFFLSTEIANWASMGFHSPVGRFSLM